MNDQLKQRLVGAAALIAFGVIFLPILLDGSGQERENTAIPAIPAQPQVLIPSDEKINTGGPIAVIEPPKKSPLSAWVVQTGSFKDLGNASENMATMRKAGFNAFIDTAKSAGTTTYRVRIGPLMTKQQAADIRQSIDDQYSLKGMVVQYRGPGRGQ